MLHIRVFWPDPEQCFERMGICVSRQGRFVFRSEHPDSKSLENRTLLAIIIDESTHIIIEYFDFYHEISFEQKNTETSCYISLSVL